MGRPREFDPDEALNEALKLFWRKGYEGTSLSDLTEAMNITRPSLYAAFGNKETLYRKALGRYYDNKERMIADALEQPNARAVVERLLHRFCDEVTSPGWPAGCMALNSSIACCEEAERIRQDQIAKREGFEARIAQRFAELKAQGDATIAAEPADLARYVSTVWLGIAVQADNGTGREDLHRTVTLMLQGWPSAPAGEARLSAFAG